MPHREHSPFHIIIGFRKLSGLHHAAHATHSGSTHRHIGFFFLLVADDTFGSQEHTGNRSGILQATRVTLAGSMIPLAFMFSYLSSRAL